jgi:26S proteasome regulatory subunit N5
MFMEFLLATFARLQVQRMKLEFYKYMVQIGLRDEAFLDVCKHFMAIFKTPAIQADNTKQLEVCACCMHD